LELRWWLYVGGCSVEVGLAAHFSKVVLVLMVIEHKCSWFMGRFYAVQARSPEWEEDRQAEEVLVVRDTLEPEGTGEEQEQEGEGEEWG
jgi:hypothetical protein